MRIQRRGWLPCPKYWRSDHLVLVLLQREWLAATSEAIAAATTCTSGSHAVHVHGVLGVQRHAYLRMQQSGQRSRRPLVPDGPGARVHQTQRARGDDVVHVLRCATAATAPSCPFRLATAAPTCR